jgi:hypothetical protein
VKSSVVENTLNPVWGETFYFTFDPNYDLEVTLFDSDFAFADSILGYAKTSLKHIQEEIKKAEEQGERSWNTWFLLEAPPAEPKLYVQGRVYMNFSIIDLSRESDTEKIEQLPLPHPLPMDPEEVKIKNQVNPWVSQTIFDQSLAWSEQKQAEGLTSSGDYLHYHAPHMSTIPPSQKYRILALDGGGVRGILSAGLLHRLVQEKPDLLDKVDLIAGSSAGGLVGLLLACGYTPQQVQAIFAYHSPAIFSSPAARRYSPFKAKYEDKNKKEIVQYYFGERTLGDLRKYVAINAFRLDGAPSR